MTHLQVKPGRQMAEAVAEATMDPRIRSAAPRPNDGAHVVDLTTYPGRISKAELARLLGFRPDPIAFEGWDL